MDTAQLVRMGVRRLSTVARESLYLKTGFDVTVPESIHCEVNERCNYKCKYCHFWRIDPYAPEMSIDEWKRVLGDLRQFLGRINIQFIGGEPFIKKGFVDLLEFCHQNSIRWGVITNGSALTPKVVSRVVAAQPLNIDVSVDSTESSVNDLVRGAPGSLKTIEAGLTRLRSERDLCGLSFPIRIKPTVTRANFRTLPSFAKWAKTHGADTIDFHPVHSLPFWSPQMRDDLWPTSEEAEEMRGVMEELVTQKSNGVPIETAAEKLRSYPDQFLGRTVKTSIAGPCRTGLRSMSIKANGDVSTCWDFPPIGNVRTTSVRDIWRSSAGKQNRHDTVSCTKVGEECANSCQDHRSVAHDIKRAVIMLKRTY